MKAFAAYRLPTLLALSLALSACAIGPDYQRPQLQTPAQFKQIEGWTQATPGDVLDGDAPVNAALTELKKLAVTARARPATVPR